MVVLKGQLHRDASRPEALGLLELPADSMPIRSGASKPQPRVGPTIAYELSRICVKVPETPDEFRAATGALPRCRTGPRHAGPVASSS